MSSSSTAATSSADPPLQKVQDVSWLHPDLS
jgi:hypothetical protein